MRRTVREDCEDEYGQPYFVVKVIDDESGRILRRSDGTDRVADSRRCENPYEAFEKPSGIIRYNNRGIV